MSLLACTEFCPRSYTGWELLGDFGIAILAFILLMVVIAFLAPDGWGQRWRQRQRARRARRRWMAARRAG